MSTPNDESEDKLPITGCLFSFFTILFLIYFSATVIAIFFISINGSDPGDHRTYEISGKAFVAISLSIILEFIQNKKFYVNKMFVLWVFIACAIPLFFSIIAGIAQSLGVQVQHFDNVMCIMFSMIGIIGVIHFLNRDNRG